MKSFRKRVIKQTMDGVDFQHKYRDLKFRDFHDGTLFKHFHKEFEISNGSNNFDMYSSEFAFKCLYHFMRLSNFKHSYFMSSKYELGLKFWKFLHEYDQEFFDKQVPINWDELSNIGKVCVNEIDSGNKVILLRYNFDKHPAQYSVFCQMFPDYVDKITKFHIAEKP
jgi:hypothetical protein